MTDDGSSVVPADIIKSLEAINTNCEEVESNLREVLAACDPDVLAELSPLDRAYTFLTLAKAVATLFTLQLRCSGDSPDEHEVKTELERLDLYTNKVEYYIDRNTARPTTTLNAQAATRFIEHSLPDLTTEQRRDMRDISRGMGPNRKSREDHGKKKKRKHDLAEKPSVAAEAAAFLAKAQKELFGGMNPGKQKEDEESEEGEVEED
eukprot:PITA_25914